MTETSSPADGKARVPLSKPVPAHGEDISELAFREPTGGDIARYGNPVKYVPGAEDATFDEVKMNRMMAALGGVPESTIAKLSAHDWLVCAWRIAGFFLMEPTTSSNSAAD